MRGMHDTLIETPSLRVLLETDGNSRQTQLIQEAIDSVAARGGGTVVLAAGLYTTGTVHLRSGVTLHLAKGAVLKASPDIAEYHRKARTTHGASAAEQRSVLFQENRPQATAHIFAENATDIALTGEGTIDGNGTAFYKAEGRKGQVDWIEAKKLTGTWVPSLESSGIGPERPFCVVQFINCRGVRFENLRIQNPPRWTVHTIACEDLLFRRVTVYSPVHAPNGDGIDLDACSNVLIEDCDIATSDDSICLKNTNMWGLKRPSRNITVRRCRLRSTTHAFTIGTESMDDFENISVTDIQISGHEGHPCITAIGLSVFQGGALRGVHISGVTVTDSVLPLYIRLGTECLGVTGYPPGLIEDILLENITVRGATGNSFMTGLPGHPLRNVTLRNVSIEFTHRIEPAEVMREVPEMPEEYANNLVWRHLPCYGLFCRHVSGLELADLLIVNMLNDARPALLLKDVESFTGSNVLLPDPSQPQP